MARRRQRGLKPDATGRSTGETRHVRLYHFMLRSPAWRHLSPVARALLIEVWERHDGENNGDIALSCRQASEALGVGKNTPTRLFRELEEKGFLRATARGAFSRKTKSATTWRLTAEPCNGEPATKEFMSWRPLEIQNTVPLSGTDSPSQRDRGQKQRSHNTVTVLPRGTVNADSGSPQSL